jgi:hypothetical protein
MYGECVIKELSEHSKNTNMVITAKNKRIKKYREDMARNLKILV